MWHGPLPVQPLIRLEKVSERFGRKIVLPPTDLTLFSGDFMAVTGPNGGGKTTLLRIMLGLLRPTSGKVIYLEGNRPVSHLHIGYMPQKNSVDSRFPITVKEVVCSGLLTPPGHHCDAHSQDNQNEALETVMETFGLSRLSENVINSLSGGQLQRTLLARAFVSRPDILMLDEPLSYLDAEYERVLCSLLEAMRGKATIVVVSHQLAGILNIATRHISVDYGITTIS